MSGTLRDELLPRGRRMALALALGVLAIALLAPTATAAERRAVSLVVEPSGVGAGEDVELAGEVAPARRGHPVVLSYRRVGGRYRVLERTKVARDGGFSFTAAPPYTGSFRTSTPDGSGDGEARSDGVEVQVESELTVDAEKHVHRNTNIDVSGRLRPEKDGREIVIQAKRGSNWDRVASTETAGDGTFLARWETSNIGSYDVRAKFEGDGDSDGVKQQVDHPTFVYRSKHASWYGPGFYGNRTACGQTLRRDTLGVAHKELPCGTEVRFYYRGETVRVPVIDRGPFIEGREWDLTEKTKDKLGFPDVDEIWSTK